MAPETKQIKSELPVPNQSKSSKPGFTGSIIAISTISLALTAASFSKTFSPSAETILKSCSPKTEMKRDWIPKRDYLAQNILQDTATAGPGKQPIVKANNFIPFQTIEILLFDAIPNLPGTSTALRSLSSIIVNGPLEYDRRPVKQVVIDHYWIYLFYEDGQQEVLPPGIDIRIRNTNYLVTLDRLVGICGPERLFLKVIRPGPDYLSFKLDYNRYCGGCGPEKKTDIESYGKETVFGSIWRLIKKNQLPPMATERLTIRDSEFEGITFQTKREFTGWKFILPIPKKAE